MSFTTKLLIVFLTALYLLSNLFDKVDCIGCFVCSSRNGSNPYCEDPFKPGLLNNSYKEKCKVPKRKHVGEFPAHFCIKVIGTSYVTNEKIVNRLCTTHTMENQCGNFQLEDDLLRGCILTCNLDGCNSAKSFRPSGLLTTVPLILAVITFPFTSVVMAPWLWH